MVSAPMAVVLPPLSFSTLRAFEQCPRSVTYRKVLRLPDLTVHSDATSGAEALSAAMQDAVESGALLAAGDFGRLVHRALERWARARMATAPARPPQAYLDEALADLALRTKAAERKRAGDAVHAAISALDGWQIVAAEAPFTLQMGGVITTGFIDLLARDAKGASTIIDYKTGEGASAEYALQLGIYREAARRVYSIDDAACAIGRFDRGTFAIEPVDVPGLDEIEPRIQRIAAGMRASDLTPKPGEWCWSCAYRAAPCDAYPRTRR